MSLNIVMVHSESSWGGNLKMVLAISGAIKERGWRVFLLHPEGEEYSRRFIAENITTIPYKYRGKFDPSGIYNISVKLKEFDSILLHSHNRRADLIAGMLGRLLNVPAITTQHGQINLNKETLELERTIPNQLYRLLLRTCFEKVVSVCETSLNEVREEILHPPATKLLKINNGIDTETIHPIKDKDWILSKRRELDIPDNSFIISHIASIDKKGHEIMIPAVSRIVRDTDENVRFLIAGDGPKFREAEQMIKSLGMEEHIRLLGFRDDPIDILNISDIYIHPSLSESLSISIMEAMAMELAVIATPVGGTAELVIPGKTGILIPTRDEEGLFKGIKQLLKDKEVRLRLGENARRHIIKNFSEDEMIDKYISLYGEFIPR